MSRKRQKPKFRVGQVVKCHDGSYGRLQTPRQAMPLQCAAGHPLFSGEGNVYISGSKERWYHISEIRPLTTREIGPRSGGRKR
jgi:hypothetical protein